MKSSDRIKEFVIDVDQANALYGALCNVPWKHHGGEIWACGWRGSGAIVAELRGRGEYINHYCNGNEGIVSADIEFMLKELGWTPLFGKEADDYYGFSRKK